MCESSSDDDSTETSCVSFFLLLLYNSPPSMKSLRMLISNLYASKWHFIINCTKLCSRSHTQKRGEREEWKCFAIYNFFTLWSCRIWKHRNSLDCQDCCRESRLSAAAAAANGSVNDEFTLFQADTYELSCVLAAMQVENRFIKWNSNNHFSFSHGMCYLLGWELPKQLVSAFFFFLSFLHPETRLCWNYFDCM